MKVTESKPRAPVSRSAAAYSRTGTATAAAAPRPIADSSSILGIPDAELTPKVQGAIMRLMGEVESLGRAIEQSRQ